MSAIQQTLASINGGAAPVTPISLLVSAKAGGNVDSNTTAAIDTTGGSLLVAIVPYYNAASTAAISDSKGNTWTQLAAETGSLVTGSLFYVKNPTVGSGHTFTQTNAAPGVYSGLIVAAFDLVANAVADNSTGDGIAPGTSTLQPGSITPSVNNCLLVTGCGYFDQPGAGLSTVDSGFTLIDRLTDALTVCAGLAYKVQTTAAAVNPTWTVPVGYDFGLIAVMAAFKHA